MFHASCSLIQLFFDECLLIDGPLASRKGKCDCSTARIAVIYIYMHHVPLASFLDESLLTDGFWLHEKANVIVLLRESLLFTSDAIPQFTSIQDNNAWARDPPVAGSGIHAGRLTDVKPCLHWVLEPVHNGTGLVHARIII